MAQTPGQPSITATCLCGAISYALPTDQRLPVDSVVCHCSDCRYVTGALYLSSPQLPAGPPQDILKASVHYDSSSTRRRWFCGNCGSHMFVQEIGGEERRWWVLGGVLEQTGLESRAQNTTRVTHHNFVTDTGDGALVAKMIRLGGREVQCWEKGAYTSRQVSEVELREMSLVGERKPGIQSESLEAKCHCEGVNIRITRPNFDSLKLQQRYLPEQENKYVAGLCTCRSCRLATGVSFQPWAYIPPVNIFLADTGKMVRFGAEGEQEDSNGVTTLRHIWSSEDTCRSFCGRCGATVFYWHNNRPEVVDVSVGVLRSQDGAMARNWLSWRKEGPSFKEDCVDEELLRAIFPP
ncbi:uncharacterized protein Z520_07303 [Fonsecaea multimorphosa CBS 102226]|uniref:CENP-V/GFA domain-containing protein n=1 Tax=Fonsecaea multimorphosa CBS 102226 TaxID=1442371 RepID=A0A0D2K2B2_9EURO|nr:uncharacterized protein Z520_07303 [Fonsecaea multimorphosa CBS 102226]KIX97189.1 hypothetical protein Z520_07303 [Fonsecaea multimorphosa CBS 102226]OAL22965.1 hypothetical protein AYO22_06873 [Fonsecaea multimorphosa]